MMTSALQTLDGSGLLVPGTGAFQASGEIMASRDGVLQFVLPERLAGSGDQQHTVGALGVTGDDGKIGQRLSR